MEDLDTVTKIEAEKPETAAIYRMIQRSRDYFNYKIASITAAGMGGIVFLVNYCHEANHGILGATTAGLKQAAYTFLAGGLLTRSCEWLTTRAENPYLARALGISVPTATTIILTYGVHLLKGTPEPFDSTVPTMIAAPVAFGYWSNRTVQNSEQNNQHTSH